MEKTDALAALSALAQETRLDVFRLLVAAGPEGLAVGRIAVELGLAAATLSFHLSHLRQAGIVTCRRRGRMLIHAADFTRMGDLMDYLSENCCAGADCGLPRRGVRA